jgi:hypothetical protein
LNTGSECKDVNTLDTFGLHYESNTNTHYLDTNLIVTGSVTATSFTGSLLGTASYAPNIYNTDGELTGNRVVTLGGNNLTFVADQGETFEIASDPASDVLISGLPAATTSNVVYYNTTSGKLTYGAATSGSGAAFPYTGSAEITGSLSVTGSVRTPVIPLSFTSGTASMDLSKGNAFSVELTTSSISWISASNIVPNQHVVLLISQSATGIGVNGNLFFTDEFYFASSSQYTPSTITGSKDILTFETFTFNPPVLANTSISKRLVPAQDPPTGFPSGSGGIEYISGSYKIHEFTSSGDFTLFTTGSSPYNEFELLVVGGGGGGGSRAGGGGGGGGVIYMTGSQEFIATTYRMIIGAGGAGAIDGITGRGVSGSSTLITSSVQGTLYTAIGGGGGGGYPYASDGDGGDGGSGGGGQSYSSTVTGLALQPFLSGSSGLYGNGSDGAPAFNGSGTGGGGGGAGGLAPSGIPNFDSYINGADGLGVLNFLTSSLTSYYGGGGGGANDCANPTSGSGGLGGGGRGETCNIPGETGSANTGGGGGGGGGGFEDGGNGGSGIIYVKYRYTV